MPWKNRKRIVSAIMEGANVKLRNSMRLTGPRTLVSEQFVAMKDAPEKLLVHVKAEKR